MCEVIIDGETVEFEGSVLTQEALEPYRDTTRHIKIYDTVTEINGWAFSQFRVLESIEIPDSVKKIGQFAFYGCETMESIIIPDSITTIRECVFDSCKSLKSVTIPNSVKNIEDGAFSDCIKLKKVTIPASVTYVGSRAFIGCDNIVVKISDADYVFSEKTLWGKPGQIITVDNDGDEYSVLNYNDTNYSVNPKLMVITGYVDYAGGKIYSGYEIDGKLNPPRKKDLYCYKVGYIRLYEPTLKSLKELLDSFDIR